MTARTPRLARCLAFVGSAALCATVLSAPAAAQSRPPIPGVTGVVTPEGGGDGATEAIATVAEKTAEGARAVVRGVAGIFGRGNGTAKADPLAALTLGMTVVVSFDAERTAVQDRDESATRKTTEARVIDIDRPRGIILLRLADRTTERLRLAERTESSRDADASREDPGEIVTVSASDPGGERVLIRFRRVL